MSDLVNARSNDTDDRCPEVNENEVDNEKMAVAAPPSPGVAYGRLNAEEEKFKHEQQMKARTAAASTTATLNEEQKQLLHDSVGGRNDFDDPHDIKAQLRRHIGDAEELSADAAGKGGSEEDSKAAWKYLRAADKKSSRPGATAVVKKPIQNDQSNDSHSGLSVLKDSIEFPEPGDHSITTVTDNTTDRNDLSSSIPEDDDPNSEHARQAGARGGAPDGTSGGGQPVAYRVFESEEEEIRRRMEEQKENLERLVEERNRSLQGLEEQFGSAVPALKVEPISEEREQELAAQAQAAKDKEEYQQLKARRCTCMATGCVLLSGLVVVIFLAVAKPWDNDDSTGEDLEPVPTVTPTVTMEPTTLYRCFEDGQELQAAVDDYYFAILDGEELGSGYDVSLTYGYPIGTWCVGKVTDFSHLFAFDRNGNLSAIFNEDISDWDTSSATTMVQMFRGTPFNHNLSTWDVSRVTDMRGMFRQSAFDGDVSTWDVSNCLDMRLMFETTNFTGDISNWDVSNVGKFEYIFRFNTLFNADVSRWNMSSATSIRAMFHTCHSFTGDVSNWDVSSVTNMHAVFYHTYNWTGDVSRWNTSRVETMFNTFAETAFNGDLSAWDVSRVENFGWMFVNSTSFNQDLSAWDVSSGTDFSGLLLRASNFSQDLCSWGPKMKNDTIVADAFLGSGCESQVDPVLNATDGTPPGPFCSLCRR